MHRNPANPAPGARQDQRTAAQYLPTTSGKPSNGRAASKPCENKKVKRQAKGAGGARCKLTPAELRELEAVLEAGPAAWGWQDQCWTLARIAELVRRRFGVGYTLAGLDVLLHRVGWSVQVPARRAAERDEAAIAAWREETWPVIKGRRRTWEPGSASRTSPARA